MDVPVVGMGIPLGEWMKGERVNARTVVRVPWDTSIRSQPDQQTKAFGGTPKAARRTRALPFS